MTKAHSLILEDVTKVFQTPEGRAVIAADRVCLQIAQGEFVTLLGPSGCGKTTTLRMIAGFEFPTSGRILLDGKDIASTPPNKREMGMVFQSYALFPHLTVFENIAYGLRLRRISRAEIERIVHETTALVNLSGLEQRRPAALSGGQQQRVALARALAIRPRVLLFDEPLSNLDAKLRVALRSEIRQLQQRLGITSLYVTHDQAEAMSLSDRVVVMNGGRIEQVGAPAEVYRRPASRFVADFIGQANFLPVVATDVTDGYARVMCMDQGFTAPAHPDLKPGPALLMVRPECACLCETAQDRPAFDGVVQSVTYVGNVVEYAILSRDQTINIADHDSVWDRLLKAGDAVRWTIDPRRVYVLNATAPVTTEN